MSGEDGGLPDSPAAAVRARRESRTPIPERLREAAREDDSDEAYEPEEEEQYDSDLDADKDDWVCAHTHNLVLYLAHVPRNTHAGWKVNTARTIRA